jgi:UDP-N-acetylmuramyl pentapeptide phosphotransferase/UDP-N-acetylglucosamine-1-phosphate transferase
MPVSVVIPAYRADDTIGATVAAARALLGVAEVIVVDDGSGDDTGAAARAAGADLVIVLPRNVGKGGALAAGVAAARHETLLFLDADLGDSAARAAPLLDAVAGRHAMSIAVLPKRERTGGFGLAKGLAAAIIRLFTGLRVEAPLSGQRAFPADLIRRTGLAPRFAVETALTVEAAHLGVPIVEVPVDLDHHHTGRTVSGFRHRFGQFRDILRYALPVLYGIGWPGLSRGRTIGRLLLWLAGFAALLAFAHHFPLAWVGPWFMLVTTEPPDLHAGSDPAFLLSTWHVPPAAVILVLLSVAALLLWPLSLCLGAVVLGSRKVNYLGRRLPGAAGLLIPLVALLSAWLGPSWHPFHWPMAIVVAVFGSVGLPDDLYGHLARARGLRGHLRALLHGRLTTGAVKAIGGLAAGLGAAYLLDRDLPHAVSLSLLDGLVIALTANLINLLDLRPGRALKAFALLAAAASVRAAVAFAFAQTLPDDDLFSAAERAALALPILLPVLAAALVLAPSDLAGRVMMGDVGANVLGGVAGLGLVLVLSPGGRIAALVALLALHLYCERASLTDLFARNRVLRWLDRLGTEGRPPLPAKEPVP